MEKDEAMILEEVADTAVEEIGTTNSKGKLKTAAIGGLTALIGGLVVQYVVIPTIAKVRKKKKNSKKKDSEVVCEAVEVDDFDKKK